jgi:hypothetical protein
MEANSRNNMNTLLIAGVVFCILCVVGDIIPPESATITSIGETAVRINSYIGKNGRPPESLENLPIRQNYANSIFDGWKRKIIYIYDPTKRMIRLASYGKDGKLGGQGKNQDIIREIIFGR